MAFSVTRSHSTPAGLGYGNADSSVELAKPSLPNSLPISIGLSGYYLDDAQDLAPHHFTTIPLPLPESPFDEKIRRRVFFFEMPDPLTYLDTPEDRSDPISQFIDGLRSRRFSQSYETYPSGGDSPYAADVAREPYSGELEGFDGGPQCDCEHCGEGYFATWEEDEDDYLDQELSVSSESLDNEGADNADDSITPCASSYTRVLHTTPGSSGAQTRSIGSFSNDSVNPPNAPRLEAAPFPLPIQLPSEPEDEIQRRFHAWFDESGWRYYKQDDLDEILSCSSSSDSCPSTPPLSDEEDITSDRDSTGHNEVGSYVQNT